MFKKISILISLLFLIIFSNDSFVFAVSNDLNDNEGYQELLYENENNDDVENYSQYPEVKPTGWGAFMSRSTYTSTSSTGVKQYTHPGNRVAAESEFSKLGGTGEVTTYVNGANVTHVKQTSAGHVTLYTSTSTTAGAVRPTISHVKDKIRFLGD